MLLRTLLSLGTGSIAATLFLLPAPCTAAAFANASINGAADEDVQFVTSSATATTLGPAAVGTAAASADLSSGTLGAAAGGDANDVFGSLDADASSRLEDVLFLVPGQGSPVTPVLFTIFMDVDGTLDVTGNGVATSPSLQQASARATAALAISGFAVTGVAPASFTVTRLVQASAGDVLDDSTTVGAQQNTAGSIGDAIFDVRLTATAMVTPNSGFNIAATITAESAAEAAFSSDADMFDTAQLGLIVPDGYSLTSSSGVFLTVPEPGSPASFAMVAALVGLRRWKRT